MRGAVAKRAKKTKREKPKRAKRRGDRWDGRTARAALERWIRYRRPEDRTAAIEAVLPRVRLGASIYAAQKGLYGTNAEDMIAAAGAVAVSIVDRWKRKNRIAQLSTMIRYGIIDIYREEQGRAHLGRSKVRAAEVPFIRKQDLLLYDEGTGSGKYRDARRMGRGVIIDAFIDARAPDDCLRIDHIEEATLGLRRITSARHRAVLTLVIAGWSLVSIGEAFDITESRVSQMMKEGRELARAARRRAEFAAGGGL